MIDAHVHAYSDEIIADPQAFAARYQESHWATLVCPINKKSLQGWVSPDQLFADAREVGINHQVLLGWYWQGEPATHYHNQFYSELLQEHRQEMTAFASLPMIDRKVDIAEVERLFALGFAGIGEVHLGIQPVDTTDPSWHDLLALLERENRLINFHITEELGRPHAGAVPTPLPVYLQIAEQYPQLNMILSHGGASVPYYFQNPFVKKKMSNVYFDTAAFPLLYDLTAVSLLGQLVGADKFLFGSDFPLKIYPSETPQAGRKQFIERLEKIVPSPWQNDFFKKNITRILPSLS